MAIKSPHIFLCVSAVILAAVQASPADENASAFLPHRLKSLEAKVDAYHAALESPNGIKDADIWPLAADDLQRDISALAKAIDEFPLSLLLGIAWRSELANSERKVLFAAAADELDTILSGVSEEFKESPNRREILKLLTKKVAAFEKETSNLISEINRWRENGEKDTD
ncbi:MAG: hypothetical protein R3F11_08850 [Verrucomicrobiales bacterium]